MVVLSVMRVASVGLRGLQKPLLGNSTALVKGQTDSLVRFMGHGRKMVIRPSRLEYTRFKDHLHFYFLLGLLPMSAVIFYANVFIGKAELVDIPDGYEPKHWEYYSHPIERWFARYVYSPPEKEYEKALHVFNLESEKAKLRRLEHRVEQLMAEKQDYKGWYYVPVNERAVYKAREVDDYKQNNYGES